jgi:hypothetical protein
MKAFLQKIIRKEKNKEKLEEALLFQELKEYLSRNGKRDFGEVTMINSSQREINETWAKVVAENNIR